MKLIVLYRQDGRIVALSRVPEAARDDAGVPMPRSGVAPGPGQHAAIVELEPAWHDRPLAEIHRRCTVVREGDRVRLRDRDRHAE
jgi:hypothetical protein